MPELLFDFMNKEQAAKFPRHGWATNSRGDRILRFPMLGLLQDFEAVRNAKGVTKPLPQGIWSAVAPFRETLRKLVKTLCELSMLERRLPASLDADQGTLYDAWEVAPLFVDLAFGYFRRLADRLASAIRPIIFDNYHSAPREYKNLLEQCKRGDSFTALGPLVDLGLFKVAIAKNSAWYESLAGESNISGKKGFRDSMEHRPVHFLMSASCRGNEPVKLEATILSSHKDVSEGAELISELRVIAAQFCNLLSAIHLSTGWACAYGEKDILLVRGNYEDITSFWPEI